jgi:putative MATE family efflux protein
VNDAGARRLDAEIWGMAWPVVGSLLMTNVVELVDIAMVGRLGRDAVAAVGYAAQYAHLVRTMLVAVGVGCVALLSRAIGGRDIALARRQLAATLLVAVGFAAPAALIVSIAPAELIGALHAETKVAALAAPYFRLSIGATLLFGVSAVLENAQRAHRNTRIPLTIAAVVAVLKIVLNLLLIFGALGFPRLELFGAGLATLGAESVAVILYVFAARVVGSSETSLVPSLADLRAAPGALREVLRVSLPAVGERLVMSVALLVYFAILARYGSTAIAAYAIGVRLLAFSWLPGLAFGAAAATLVGQALGAGATTEARRAGWRATGSALILMAGLGVGCAFLREPLARVFTHDAGIIEQLSPFLLALAIAQPFMGVHFSLSGGLRGAGDTLTPLLGATLGNWVLRIPFAWFAARAGWSIGFVWAALVVDHVARSIWYVISFRRGHWARPGIRAGTPSHAR